jgi:hypothetical protein
MIWGCMRGAYAAGRGASSSGGGCPTAAEVEERLVAEEMRGLSERAHTHTLTTQEYAAVRESWEERREEDTAEQER